MPSTRANLVTRRSLASELYLDFSAQTAAHLEKAILYKLKLVYIASNSAAELALVCVAAANHPSPLIAVSSPSQR